jgi:hypothetical protein
MKARDVWAPVNADRAVGTLRDLQPYFDNGVADPDGIRFALAFSGVTGMLRIITTGRGNTFHLELHGAVAGEFITVLERHWRGILEQAPTATLSIGLSNVEFIDPAAEQLLRRMSDCGVQFDGGGCLNRYVIEKISGGM